MKQLRGHHLFCAALFQGCGYNEAFTRSMEEALAALAAGEGMSLVYGSDDLCKACPHCLPGNACGLGTSDVLRRDQAAREACGLSLGQELSPVQVGERLRQVNRSQWEKVCGGCRWQREGLCSWELFERLRKERFL